MNEKAIEKIIKEIDEMEKKLASAMRDASFFSSESMKRKYLVEAEVLKEQIERKMVILDMLTRRA